MKIIAIVVLAAAPAATAWPASNPSSDKLAASFEKDITGWTALSGARVLHEPRDGDPGPGALRAVADSQGSLMVVGPCVRAMPGREYAAEARLKTASGAPYFCSVNAWQYSDDKCESGDEALLSAAAPPKSAWATVTGAARTAAATKSVQLKPVCSGPGAFEVLFDSLVLGPR